MPKGVDEADRRPESDLVLKCPDKQKVRGTGMEEELFGDSGSRANKKSPSEEAWANVSSP